MTEIKSKELTEVAETVQENRKLLTVSKALQVFTLITVLCGLLWDGVSMRQLVLSDHAIIERYEQHGTPAVVDLRTRYDTKFDEVYRRLDKFEAVASGINRIEGSIEVLTEKLRLLDAKITAAQLRDKSSN